MRVVGLLVLLYTLFLLSKSVSSSKVEKSDSRRSKIPALGIDYSTTTVFVHGKALPGLSRVSIVGEQGALIYEANVSNVEDYNRVKYMVDYITNCRILVGYNLSRVLKLLRVHHPKYLLRDTLFFYSFCKKLPGVRKSLKTMTKDILGWDIEATNTSENAIVAMEIYKKYVDRWEEHIRSRQRAAFALDCEMVECVRASRQRVEVVAKLSIVDHLGDVVYDRLFKPELPVSSYRTFVTGLVESNFTDALYLTDERERLESLLDGNIVVGHAVGKDLSLLGIHHPFPLIRDSSTFDTFCSYFPNKKTPSLKELAKSLLNMTIQRGHHDSTEDAHATMLLYLKFRSDWDEQIDKIAEVFVTD